MAAEEELLTFIGATFRSVWTLELLCHLRNAKGDASSPEELIVSLRASELVVRRSLDDLVAAGLISLEEDGEARYSPASADLDRLAAAAEARYATSPNAVRRIIVRAANPGLTAFSDAFRLGGNK